MTKIIMIRHFETPGNREKRYIGITDEPLYSMDQYGNNKVYPEVDIVFSSPRVRCLDTAKIIYPDHKIMIEENLAECNFGDFENKSYIELSSNPDYQKWVDSGGRLPFPNGESMEEFKARCLLGFEQVVKTVTRAGFERIAFVIHGGTIMGILEELAYPKKDFYHWQIKNGEGFEMKMDSQGRLIHICGI